MTEKHAVFGASNAERWWSCPGSTALVEKVPPPPPSPYAREGTAAHALIERAIQDNLSPAECMSFRGMSYALQDGGPPVEVTADLANAIAECVAVAREQIALLPADGTYWTEVRFSLESLRPPAPMFGTADLVLWDPGAPAQRPYQRTKRGRVSTVLPKPARPAQLKVIDFKLGRGVVVEAEHNKQLMYYALGAILELQKVPEVVDLMVVQPRGEHPDGPVRIWTVSFEDLRKWKHDLFQAVEAALEDDADLNLGSWCRFCRAKAICPAQRAQAEEAVGKIFLPAPVTPAETPPTPEGALPAPVALEKEDLLEIMEKIPFVRSWFTAIEQRVRELTEQGEDTGYKLVPTRPVRRWVDEAQTQEYLEPRIGKEMYVSKLVSPAQAERALKRHNLTPLPEKLWTKISGGTKMVPADDPRPAIAPTPPATDVFVADAKKALPASAESAPKSADPAKPTEPSEPAEPTTPASSEGSAHRYLFLIPDGEDWKDWEIFAANEKEARRIVRERLGRKRLPRHTRVTRTE